MFDTAGSRMSFPVVAGVAETFRASFWMGSTVGMSVLGATFQAACYVAHGDERGELVAVLPVEHDGSRENAVLVTVPELEHGHYHWELRATDSEGRESRLLYGTLSALNAADAEYVVRLAEESELRELSVQMAEGHAGPLMLRWQSCAAASSLVVDAAKHAAEAHEAAKEARDSAQVAGESEAATLSALEAAQAFMASFNEALYNAIRIDSNSVLWVGGYCTGHVLKGEPGVTPHIGLDGFWYEGNQRLGDRPAFGKDGITPHITPDGFWAFGDFKSNTRAEGRDGLDGSAVRMILVDSYEEIPQSGETCNGGFRYLVKNVGWSVVGDPDVTGSGEWEAWEIPAHVLPSEFTHLRVPGVLNDNSVPVYLMVRTSDGQVLGVSRNAVTWAVGDVVTWEFSEPVRVPNNKTVQIFLRKSPEGVSGSVPFEEVLLKSLSGVGACRTRYRGVWYAERAPYFRAFGDGGAESYDHYAWVEHDGEAGWVRVDRNNEIATSRVYGVMKYATDMTVDGGAPVGQNAAGQASVPLADPAMPGAVLPSSANNESEGGRTHVGGDKKLYVDFSTPSTPGVGKTSYTVEVENTASVGMTSDNKYAVPPAAAFQWGAVKIGSSVPQSMGMPWIIPVGAAAAGVMNEYGQNIRGQLMNNVLVNGALRTATKETWISWAPNGVNLTILPDGSNAVGIMAHPDQFTQSAVYGLELLVATTSTLGGVTICETIGSGSGLVPTVDAVLKYLALHYYTKPLVYSKEETYSKSQVDAIDRINRQDAAATYKTVVAAKSDHDALSGRIEGCVKKTATVDEICQMTLSEYQALKVRNPKCIYLLTED